jgi:hypothetical protein
MLSGRSVCRHMPGGYWNILSPLSDETEARFSVLCCTISTYFHRFTLLASVKFKNVFCSESHFNCS